MQWEPPSTLVFYDSPAKTQLNIDQAADSVVDTVTSMVLKMEATMKALGKESLKELGPDDLVALDALTAKATGVKRVFKPRGAGTPPTASVCSPTKRILKTYNDGGERYNGIHHS